jgi:hypothetical protein
VTTSTLTDPPTAHAETPAGRGSAPADPPRITGMTCRNCGLGQPLAIAYVCPACFGPLEVTYDLSVVGRTLTHEAVAGLN